MAYSDRLQSLKDALDSYSENDLKLASLYKTARERNEISKSNELKRLESEYKSDRNSAYADVARDERNLLSSLSARGLGFSGETAQAKLNSSLALQGRLSELASEKSDNALAINKEYLENDQALSVEEAEKRQALSNDRAKLLHELAKTELDAEQKEKELSLERELANEKLKAEKEMHEASLSAKNNQSQSQTSNKTQSNVNTDEENTFFSPEISPKDLAKLTVVNATGGDYIDSERDAYLVNRYLLQMQEDYDLSDEYMHELIFMLKAYGHKELTLKELRRTVITTDAKDIYSSAYEKRYKEYIDTGMKTVMARHYAQGLAAKDTLTYLFDRTESASEFYEYCKLLGIEEESARSFAKDLVWYNKDGDEKSEPKQVNKRESGVSLIK